MPNEAEADSRSPVTEPVEPPVSIRREWCKACGICIEFCPKKVFDADEEGHPIIARPEECSSCQICEQLCPDFAVSVRRKRRAPKS
ncbi:MAG TPA: ferredoxin [Clostridiales bacterium]|nr:ferredoxin [Clostridiales bacterium]